MSNCPHCTKAITTIRIRPLTGTAPNSTSWKCLAFCCPQCSAIISVDIDMTSVRQELMDKMDSLKRP